ncbi:MAG: glycoside hydrolase family 5 protein [Prevotellaceae bacterium]|jgi:endoglucanase|nr:glycoside hydrolase family 5 protein [Prevotellaceae bacterium]
MKKIFILCSLLLVLNTGCNGGQTSPENDTTFVGTHGFLAVKGTALVDKNGEPIVLRGVSFGWHNWWARFYNAQTVATLKNDWKANVVRAAIGVEPNGALLNNPALAYQCMMTVADAAIDNDMYVIIDFHAHNINLDAAKSFFTQTAARYKNSPNVIYEIYNEPDYETWAEVKSYSVEIIKTIREIAPKSVIIVGSPHWDQDVDVAAADPILNYENLMYSLHFYAATHKQDLRTRAENALKTGLPIFVSECAGMEASGDGAINIDEWNAWVNFMEERKLSYAMWSISNKAETCSMIKDEQSPISDWTESDLKEWGKIARNLLRGKN